MFFTDYKKASDRLKKKVWVQHPDGKKEEADSSRLYRFTGDADFRLADNDDFFGFTTEEIDMPYWKQVLIAIGMLVVLWFVLVVWFSF